VGEVLLKAIACRFFLVLFLFASGKFYD